MVSKRRVSDSWWSFKLSRIMLSKKVVSRKKLRKRKVSSVKKTSPKSPSSAGKTEFIFRSSRFDRFPSDPSYAVVDCPRILPLAIMESSRPDQLPVDMVDISGKQIISVRNAGDNTEKQKIVSDRNAGDKTEKGLTTFGFVYGGVVTVDGKDGGQGSGIGTVQNVVKIDSRMIVGDCEVLKALLDDLQNKYSDHERLEVDRRIPVLEEASPARDMIEGHRNDIVSRKKSSAWSLKSILNGIFSFWRKS
ncbi:OLC1v1013735C1 [Oldenlandia corymbosa var. corymbosa]|uniref:OLC1v1013735C1 n=1 Tax=Oldenlandia corymbosa var. corymbosa TaxID=529605 RepID=A0AAV1DZ49_OLDCO|nr:OLC1v1013735C1 [Oldenlandia corymbosa var. corymbosa]